MAPSVSGGESAAAGVHLLAGSTSAAISSVLFQPLDLVKTRIQISQYRQGTLQMARMIAIQDSVWGLWKGTSATLYRIIPGSGLYFLSLESLNRLTLPARSSLTAANATRTHKVLASALDFSTAFTARCTATALIVPVAVVKTRIEAGTKYRSVLHALYQIGTTERSRGLFSGLVPTLLRDAPFSGIFYTAFQRLKQPLDHLTAHGVPAPIPKIIAGISAGSIATAITHPADVLKTRMQMAEKKTQREGIVKIIRQIYQRDGMWGFYRGFIPRMIKRSCFTAFTWTFYEEILSAYSTLYSKKTILFV